jgi:hypothetical protein
VCQVGWTIGESGFQAAARVLAGALQDLHFEAPTLAEVQELLKGSQA